MYNDFILRINHLMETGNVGENKQNSITLNSNSMAMILQENSIYYRATEQQIRFIRTNVSGVVLDLMVTIRDQGLTNTNTRTRNTISIEHPSEFSNDVANYR